ncbi:MAG: hypothetical protein J0G96_06485 [Flavobacteriia bacterium]|nr:hypothetical protein [Flavobacteriia bacterium]
MLVRKTEYKELLDYLKRQRSDGYEFVAFPCDYPATKYELEYFSTYEEAHMYCFKAVDTCDLLAIRSAYRVMSEGLRDPELLVERYGYIDIAAMIENYHKRLDAEQSVDRQRETEILNTKNNNVMNEKNYEYLNDQVRFTGFGDGLSEDLKTNISKGKDTFQLHHSTSFGEDEVKAELKFSKSKESDMYFFNSYDVQTTRQGEKEPLKQTFYINNKGPSITLKEAYNLINGRAVNKNLANKEGDMYNVWLQMDFKHSDERGNFKFQRFSENYGFDLENTLAKYPIKELTNEQYKDALMDSLKKGNRQSATFIKEDGQEIKRYIEASPQFKTINVYGEDNRIRIKESQQQSQKQDQSDTTQKNANKNKQGNKSEDQHTSENAKQATAKRSRNKRSMTA